MPGSCCTAIRQCGADLACPKVLAPLSRRSHVAQLQEEQKLMVQRSTGEWQSETLPTRHKRRDTRWALEDASKCRLPIIGKPEIPLQTVGAVPSTGCSVTRDGLFDNILRVSAHA